MNAKPSYEYLQTLHPEGSAAAKMIIGCPSHALRTDYEYFSGNTNWLKHPSSTDTVMGYVCQVCGTEVWFKRLTDTTLL